MRNRRALVGMFAVTVVIGWAGTKSLLSEPGSAFGFEPGERVADLAFDAVQGTHHRLNELVAKGPVVIAMRDVGCPVAAKYAPRIARMEREYAGRGVRFVLIETNATTTREQLHEELRVHGFDAPYAHDADGALTGALRARTTTEVFLIDAARTLVYRGAIDDQYGITYTRPAVRETWLRDAIDATLAGDTPAVRQTDAQGCFLPDPDPSAAQLQPVTYHTRVSRIIQDNCQTCHRAGGIAPFGLETYEQVLAMRAMVKYVLEINRMPPWFAAPGTGDWANERRLSDRDRADLLAWIEAGAPEGNPRDAPQPRHWVAGWNIGRPDTILEIPDAIDVPAEGVIDYKYVYLKTDFAEDRWIRAMELRPTAPQVTHHVLAFIEDPEVASAPRQQGRPAPQGGINGYFTAYVPGAFGHVFPDGAAKLLPKGAWLKFQLHYTPNGKPATDRTRLALQFMDGPPQREVQSISAFNTRFEIPPGASRHEVSGTRLLRQPGEVIAFFPHMHLRGSAFRYDLVLPDGTEQALLDVPRYDFNWQISYLPRTPVRVPAGARIRATGWFDNSTANPANPDPNSTVRFGEQTFEEMMIGYFDFIPDPLAAGGR